MNKCLAFPAVIALVVAVIGGGCGDNAVNYSDPV